MVPIQFVTRKLLFLDMTSHDYFHYYPLSFGEDNMVMLVYSRIHQIYYCDLMDL